MSKIDKKTFVKLLKFLSGYVGMDDLYQPEAQDEFWEAYKKENK